MNCWAELTRQLWKLDLGVRLENSLDLGRGGYGLASPGEGDEEGIPLRIDLQAFMEREDLAQDGALIRQQVGVVIAQMR